MTLNVEIVLGLVTVFVAILAAILHIRRAPEGDWKGLFQQALSTGLVADPSRSICAHWLLVGNSDGGEAVFTALQAQLENDVVLYTGLDVSELQATLEGLCAKRSQKLVVVATGEGLPLVVAALIELPQVRDSLLAVVSFGGAMGKLDMETFTHQKLDVEQGLPVPYFSISMDKENASFPVPDDEGGLEQSILSIDLGNVGPVDEANGAVIARAIRTTVETVVWAGRA